MPYKKNTAIKLAHSLAVLSLVFLASCGKLIDLETTRVAKINEEYITRGDLSKVIRDAADDEKPQISNKGDLLRVLEKHIDQKVKAILAADLEEQGKLSVPREMAQAQYDAMNPDKANFVNIKNPESVGFTQSEINYALQQREFAIDKLHEQFKAEAAVGFRIQQGIQEGTLTVSDEEYEREYRIREGELIKFESIDFIAISIPAATYNSETEAANLRRRLDSGTDFNTLLEEYDKKKPGSVFESSIENNPSSERFRGFWDSISGCKKGDILGPVFLPSSEVLNEQGQSVGGMAAARIIFQVLEYYPVTPKTLEEAKPDMAPSILYGKMMKILRVENGVEVYKDDLPDPQMYK